jgi:hypothetical protein
MDDTVHPAKLCHIPEELNLQVTVQMSIFKMWGMIMLLVIRMSQSLENLIFSETLVGDSLEHAQDYGLPSKDTI